MINCPKCGELNGDNNTYCFKCGAFIHSQEEDYKKFCPKCSLIYSPKATKCEKCGGPLSVYSENAVNSVYGNITEKWQYILAVIFPLVGFVLGLIYIAQKDEKGPSVIGAAAAGIFLEIILFFVISSCAIH